MLKEPNAEPVETYVVGQCYFPVPTNDNLLLNKHGRKIANVCTSVSVLAEICCN